MAMGQKAMDPMKIPIKQQKDSFSVEMQILLGAGPVSPDCVAFTLSEGWTRWPTSDLNYSLILWFHLPRQKLYIARLHWERA